MRITYIGHSTILIQDENFNMLTDPFFTINLPFVKRKILPSMNIEDLPEIDLIPISHTHPDHCDFDALGKISKSASVVMPQGTSSKVRKMGFQVNELGYWESTGRGKYKITAVPAMHQGRCAGYILKGSKTIYFAGDTRFIDSMNEIGQKFDIDIAFLPISGNRFFGLNMIMGPEEAALAAESLKSKLVIPVHFGTLANIPPVFSTNGSPSDFINCIRDDRIRKTVKVLDAGESFEY
ncbi:MAG: MBL fold metallo-hydrolase [Candidatus Methanoperedens sp.]|nr:MBL fold metallo-hydrolase [Candidatus Methanoperedens sp.]